MPRFARPGAAYAFILPSALLLGLFTLWPIVQALWISLHDWSFLTDVQTFIGTANYTELLGDERFWNALRVTAIYTAATVPLQIAIALAIALALNERIRGRGVLRAAFFFPVISSLAIMAIVWSFLLDPNVGTIGGWMRDLGLRRVAFLREPSLALASVIAVGVWKNVGFSMVILLAGLQGIPREHYEAASIDGAGRWDRFRHVTVPGLRHTLLFVLVISVIASLQVFDQVYVMTRGGPLFATESLVTYMFHQGFDLFRMGYASAIATVLFVLILAISAVQLRLFRYRDVD
jgi:ABC-type sugar transport system permease subunit